MKKLKIWKKSLLLIISVTLFLSQTLPAFALWDGATINVVGKYREHENSTATTNVIRVFRLAEGESPLMPAESFTANTKLGGTGETYIYTPVEETERADFSRPVPYKMV